MFAELIGDLALPRDVDPRIFRLHLLSALNGTKFWYRAGGRTPAEIGRQLARMLRPAMASPSP
jgi:hypothetical protein